MGWTRSERAGLTILVFYRLAARRCVTLNASLKPPQEFLFIHKHAASAPFNTIEKFAIFRVIAGGVNPISH